MVPIEQANGGGNAMKQSRLGSHDRSGCTGLCLPHSRREPSRSARPTRCRPGTTARPRRRSSTSCRRRRRRAVPKFVPPPERIATFDQDGTLWVEHPMYSQVMYCLERVPAVVKAKPELAERRAVQDRDVGQPRGDREAPMEDLEKILAATLTGMSVEEFNAEVKKWLATAKDPRWKRPYTELTYQPMQEVLQVPARQRLQDLHRHRRRPGLRAHVRRAGLRHSARAGRRHRGRDEVRLRQERPAVPDQGAEARS